MSNDELILKWDKLYSKCPNLEWADIRDFNENIQASYNNGDITKKECVKFAGLICYLNN